ncbi:MAG: DUF2358 domain-containing protein [Symploca sp. SIO1C2]|nr:DUF2358 domain-containing protein [Symploca sp. SIO1C2]
MDTTEQKSDNSSTTEAQLQVAKVIETLQQDLPTLFKQDISYHIYTKDIYFQDPISRFRGKFNYRIIFWTLRFHAGLFFTEIYFDVHNVYQSAQDTIKVDWTVRGNLLLPWKPKLFFNGNSTYTLTKEGLIYNHLDTWDRKPGEIWQQFFRKGS